MTTRDDALLADVRAYLRQRREDGLEWFLPTAETPAAVSVNQPADGPANGLADPPANRPAPLAESGPTVAAAQADFTVHCATFVSETLAKIAQQSPPSVQPDMFAAPSSHPAPLTPAEKAASLAALAAEVAPCIACKLAATRTQTVFGVGAPDADLVLIGEAPGRDEDLQGEPFVGRAGQLLTEILKAIGLRRDDVYICNILKCRPPENRDPERDEVDSCAPFLQRQLEIIAPKVICCLGRHAAHTLLGTTASLGTLRESVHFHAGIPVMVTFHPAALLRNPHWKRPTWDDVRRLRALYDALRARG